MIDFEAGEIANWAGMPDAPHQFPRLISKLILATIPVTSFIDMPSGSSVWLPGWDGLLEVNDDNPWVPIGKSAWEFSAGQESGQKAKENYAKRTTESLGVDTKSTTFVFATPRVWNGKRKWLSERNKESEWADVCAYDAGDLAAWLGQAPGVADWFAKVIHKLPNAGFTCLDYWWENWASVTKPDVAPELVLAGRSEQADAVMDWLGKSPSSFYMRGDTTKDEAIAFLAASALISDYVFGASLLSKAVVVDTPEAWRSLVYSNFPLVLIRNFEGDVSSQIGVNNGHHVVVPLDGTQEPRGNGIELPKLGRDESIEALTSMGLSEPQARALSRKSARRLPVIRRHLLEEAGAPLPEWTSPAPSRSLVSLVLIGQWSEEKEGDKEIVAKIAGKPYQEVEQELTPLLNMADAPLTKIGARWRYVSHEEAWHILAPHLTPTDIQRLEELAFEILSRKHPKFDLPAGERWYANIKGKVLPHSETLVEGVARGLALIGTQHERMVNIQEAQYILNRVVYRVLGHGSDWRTWATLNRHLATLAEAAPDAFLASFERLLDAGPSHFMEHFEQDKDPMFSGSPPAGLLWGLERLAWSKDYFSRVVLALARLAEIDPGAQSTNRPAESVRNLFHWKFRFTEATDEDRLNALALVLSRSQQVGWDVLVKNLSFHSNPHRNLLDLTMWQEWGQDGYSESSYEERDEFVHGLCRLLLENITSDIGHWESIMRILSSIPQDTRRQLLEMLMQQADALKQDSNLEDLRTAIRFELHRHRSHPDAWWAMPSNDVEMLNAIYEKLAPSDPVGAYAWLFNHHWPDLPDGKLGASHEQRQQIDATQREAVLAVFESGGIDAIERLLDAVNYPHVLGVAVADCIHSDEVFRLTLGCLKSQSENRHSFAMNLLGRRFRKSGWEIIDKALDELRTDESVVTYAIAALYMSATPADFKTCLQRLDDEVQVVRDAYWSNVNCFNFADEKIEKRDRFTAIRCLLAVRRSLSVAELIWPMEVPLDLVKLTLEQIPKDLTNENEAIYQGLSYEVAQLFERLDKSEDVSDDLIANLELPYIGMLNEHRPNLALHREVLRQPSLFADLITLYASVRLDGQYYDETLDDRTREVQFRFSFNVLSQLRGLPGTMGDGTIDAEALKTWVSEARRLCAERDRAEIGDEKIGEILANAPVGKDGAWPCELVRDLLDALSLSEDIGNGFTTGRFNQRGVSSRGIFDGGAQERELVEVYRRDAAKVAAKWPFTSKLLGEIALGYDSDARLEDTRAEWTDATYG